LARTILARSVDQSFEGIISFDDQIYMPSMYNGQFPRYGLTLIDEAQDLSPMNHIMVNRASGGRLIVVGDPKQCHPPGTKIQLSRGITKNIEDIKIGDQLVSYNRKVGFSGLNTQGTKVEDVQIFNHSGYLVRISTNGPFTHECTPNHRCMVRWENKTGYCVYLMRKGNYFRIGTAQTWYNKKDGRDFGPSMRARQERADSMWVLEQYKTKDEALIAEKVIWTKFGLPDLIFHCSGKASSTQEHLDQAWKEIGENRERAASCLKYFRRDINFPLWLASYGQHIGEKSFITQASNLIDGAMLVKVFDGTNTPTWLTAFIDYVEYNGPVIGLTVQGNGYGQNLYVANGIVTHNSIYAFRGADSESMGKLRKLRQSWIDLPLATTFRCPKIIVDRQQHHAPGFIAFHTNPIGEAIKFLRYPPKPRATDTPPLSINNLQHEEDGPQTWDWKKVESKAIGTVAVLCRNNAPLLKVAFKLLRENMPVTMLGRDIGKTLVALSKKVLPDDDMKSPDCVVEVNSWKDSQIALANANGQEEKVANIHDQAECLLAVIDGAKAENAAAIRWSLKEIFDRQSGHVTLSTIHRAKGLEWDTVLHIDPWRIPSKFAQQNPAQMRQEMNLLYVCETRCKKLLIEANLEDFE
jgi:hypothetical protein